ncbi:hypothetical protein HYS00_01505 [Candidatus Microgenomates bacterium]|nr:hypothetical protein [Candidatus Microgenomates bacterium]
MALDHIQLRKRYAKFWKERAHHESPPIPLVPQNDPTTLFTGSGMQQFVPYLLGEPHPLGTRVYNIQRCIRAQDIEEVGDNRHDSFFEDTDAIAIWQETFKKIGMDARLNERIFEYDAKKNWWSRAGIPSNMPPGEPGGPDSEVFYEFTEVPHNKKFGPKCHPNCDCGRFLEIGNNVFMQYKKNTDGSFSELPKLNVDFGGGLERLVMAAEDNPDMFATHLYQPIIIEIEAITKKSYADDTNKAAMRIISDHLKASVFLIKDGVLPSNKEQGYVLRRLLRRLTVKMRNLLGALPSAIDIALISRQILKMYEDIYFDLSTDEELVKRVIEEEIRKFGLSLERGMREIEKMEKVSGKDAFNLYQSYGFPLEVTEEILLDKGKEVNKTQFYEEFQKHKDLSRSSSAVKFKGGLADHSDQVLKYHTATHLLHQALFDLFGNDIRQEGSNITGERLRFDFYSTKNISQDDKAKIAALINEKIGEALPMRFKIMPKDEAVKTGAKSFFREKYPDNVKVYYIGGTDDHPETAYSKEFCGGPHVTNTKEIGSLSIYKLEKIGSNLYRIYAK